MQERSCVENFFDGHKSDLLHHFGGCESDLWRSFQVTLVARVIFSLPYYTSEDHSCEKTAGHNKSNLQLDILLLKVDHTTIKKVHKIAFASIKTMSMYELPLTHCSLVIRYHNLSVCTLFFCVNDLYRYC